MTSTRVFIAGSCVSRDTFSALPQGGYTLVDYVARQSLISGARPPIDYPLDLSAITSRFQQRMVQGALRGSLYESLDRHGPNTDLVLIDLTDERAGVFEMPDGSYVTRSIELDGAGLIPQISDASTRYLQFGTDEHFEVFGWAAQTLRAELDRLRLTDRTVVLAPNWAEYAIDGQYTGKSYGYTPPDANYFQQRYVDLLENYLGLRTVRLTDTRSDANHQWGLAPFHYAEPVYTYFAETLIRLVPPHTGAAPTGTTTQPSVADHPHPSSAAALTTPPTVAMVQRADPDAPTLVLVKTTSQHSSLAALMDDMVADIGGADLNIVTVTVQGPALDAAGAQAAALRLAQVAGDADRSYLTAGDGMVCALLIAAEDNATDLVVVYPEFPEVIAVPGLKKVDVHAFAEAEHLTARHTAKQADLTIKLLGTVTRTGTFLLMHDGDAVLRRAMERLHSTIADARRHARTR